MIVYAKARVDGDPGEIKEDEDERGEEDVEHFSCF
jgi:hypothetical protein